MRLLNILKNIIRKQNFQYGTIDSSETTINANTTAWLTATVASDKKVVAPTGYQLSGSAHTPCHPYAYYQIGNEFQIALRNMGTGAATVKVTFSYMYINVGGGS